MGGGSARRDRPLKRAADEAAGGLINKAWAAHPCTVFPIPTPPNHNTADIDSRLRVFIIKKFLNYGLSGSRKFLITDFLDPALLAVFGLGGFGHA